MLKLPLKNEVYRKSIAGLFYYCKIFILEVLNHYALFKNVYKHALGLILLYKWRCNKVNLTELFINCRSAAKTSQNFIFEELQRIPRSRDFRDAVEALKHVVNQQQTPRFSVII